MSITSVKLELAEAIELYEQLKANLNDRSDLHSTSEADWQSQIRTLGLDAVSMQRYKAQRVMSYPFSSCRQS